MSASVLPPTAPTTLVIVLGASAWPNSPGFQASQAFMHAAQGFRDYMLDPHGFGLPVANLLDQFDAQTSASDQLEVLGSFLEERTQAQKAANQPVRDVVVYFVGHGGFAGPSADFYLMHRRANASSLRASGMAIDALAEVLREKARQTRRYLLLDCCFAAAAFRAFQGGPDQTAITKTLDAFHVQARGSGFPGKGTVLLCSSDQKSPSLLLPDESYTMFSYALLDVFRNGDLHRPPRLSLRDLKELAEDRLAALPEKNAPRPGLYSPDQSEGDVADIPFFPNPRAEEAEQARLAVEKRLQNIEKQISPKPESVGKQRIQQYLKAYDFTTLFREELGWDTLKEAPLAIPVDGQIYTLRPLVEKRGFKVYLCSPTAQGQIPAGAVMRQIERELTKYAYEHLIIYASAAREQQAWQWVKREPGKPSASRLYRLHKGQSGELLSQKLLSLAFSIEEEDRLGTATVAARVRQALDAERVTKKFYDRFQKEHATFLTFIDGIAVQSDREWYASLMLNRLMFVYFIQKKGVLATSGRRQLDGDVDYLSHKLTETRQRHGEDQFYSFYRYFLLRLFHEGLGRRERSPELDQLLGDVPYLNGGLFDVHQLEQHYPDIQIADEAFERIFAFFDDYRWHLDERPLRNDREINPDVLGYIFEKYINQKQMGAYYTKEDITGYIGKNTVIPSLLEATEQKCSIAFTPDGFAWSLARRDPDRYIYEAVKKGCNLPLSLEIAAGIADVSQRGAWNKPVPDSYALPTEIWREVVARRLRYEEVKVKLASGAMISVNDLITYNLDLSRFAEDVIAYSEGVDLLSAFYASLETITILDPTCGSGAFLFAALNMSSRSRKPALTGCRRWSPSATDWTPWSRSTVQSIPALRSPVSATS